MLFTENSWKIDQWETNLWTNQPAYLFCLICEIDQLVHWNKSTRNNNLFNDSTGLVHNIFYIRQFFSINWTEWFVHELGWFVEDSFMNQTCSQMSTIQHCSYQIKVDMKIHSIYIISIFILLGTLHILFLP